MMPILSAMVWYSLDGPVNRLATFDRLSGSSRGHLIGQFCIIGILGDQGGHLLHAGGRFFDRNGLLARRLRERLGGRRDLARCVGKRVGGTLDLADDRVEFADQTLLSGQHLADLVLAGVPDAYRQVAVTEAPGHAEQLIDRTRDVARDQDADADRENKCREQRCNGHRDGAAISAGREIERLLAQLFLDFDEFVSSKLPAS